MEEDNLDDYALPPPRVQQNEGPDMVPQRFLALASSDTRKAGMKLIQIIEHYVSLHSLSLFCRLFFVVLMQLLAMAQAWVANTILGARFFGVLQMPHDFWSADMSMITVPHSLRDVIDGVLANGADRAQITSYEQFSAAVFGEELCRRRGPCFPARNVEILITNNNNIPNFRTRTG